ncbi:Uncharacterized membrane protein [Enterobacter sp. kpr-6]|uniref:COG4648 family protein n=1 Tax=unclassified Enterobacter TaxID=2608935 RepID=UPI0008F43DB2|nr:MULTISPECIES: hypothetical protein [unclassified Enterobacter]SFR15080.1 Uncharacterized membrane protein [Enterobacter sp. kpr-6]
MRRSRLRPGVQKLSALLMLGWPFFIWFGLTHNSLHWLLPLMALLLIVRLRQIRQMTGPMRAVLQSVALAGIALCIASSLLKSHQLLLFYPLAVNLVMLCVFAGSLWTTQPLVERLARLRDPDLSAAAVRYTRRVTQVWCVFFIINGTLALLTAVHGDMQLWTAWNGLIAYLLMGTLMAGEWLVRCRVIKRETR